MLPSEGLVNAASDDMPEPQRLSFIHNITMRKEAPNWVVHRMASASAALHRVGNDSSDC
jgi:hypothetical protein